MKTPTIAIRLGAAHDEVRVDGVVFDRSGMKGPEKRKLRRMLIDGLTAAGFFVRRAAA